MSQKAKGKQRAVEEDFVPSVDAANEPSAMEAAPHTQPEHEALPLQEVDRESVPQASTSNSPRIQPVDSIKSSQSPPVSLLFGGSSQLDQPPPSWTFEQQQISSPARKGSTPITKAETLEEFTELYISPITALSNLPSTAETVETVMVPDSQEKENTTMDTSALTNLTSLADMSISEILQMPFCSQGSCVSDEAEQRGTESILANLPSLALTGEEKATQEQEQQSSQVEESQDTEPAPKQITIQRFLTVPRVIPLHGTLDEMHCPKCQHVEPLDRHLNILESGHSIHCPRCLEQDHSRTALGERSRGVGVLKVSVVLYGEEHKQASRVGEIAEKDLLKAARPDVLIVAGTTLRIPGVKKIVKELAKVIKQPIKEAIRDAEGNFTGEYTEREDPSKRVIFVNRDAPNPEKTWNEVFDTFVQGDAQAFAALVRQEIQALKNPSPLPAAANVAAHEQKESVVHVQTSLTACWGSSKHASIGALMAGKPVEVPLMLESTSSLSAAPPAPKRNKPKAKKGKRVIKILGLHKKSPSKASQKQKLLQSKTPSPQAQPDIPLEGQAVEASSSNKATKQPKKAKRPPHNSFAQIQAELAAKAKAAKASAEKASTAKKEKPKPGWKGYAVVEETEVAPKKFEDFWKPAEGGRRRRAPAISTPVAAEQINTTGHSAKVETRESTPVKTAATAQKTFDGVEDLGASLPSGVLPMKGSSWPASAHPSVASTPPSLDSDRELMSDSDETASYRGDNDNEVSTSQETACVPPSFSAEGPVAVLLPLTQEAGTMSTSSPVIIQDSLELASTIDTVESSSQTSLASQTGVKRSRSQASPFMAFNHAIVKHASHGPTSAKRVKLEF